MEDGVLKSMACSEPNRFVASQPASPLGGHAPATGSDRRSNNASILGKRGEGVEFCIEFRLLQLCATQCVGDSER